MLNNSSHEEFTKFSNDELIEKIKETLFDQKTLRQTMDEENSWFDPEKLLLLKLVDDELFKLDDDACSRNLDWPKN